MEKYYSKSFENLCDLSLYEILCPGVCVEGGYLRCLTQGFYLYFSNSQFYGKCWSLLNLRRHKVSYTNFVSKNDTWNVDGLDKCRHL